MYDAFTPTSLSSYTTTSPSSVASSGFIEALFQPASSRPSRYKMMKIVVVGTNGFAQFLATCLQSLTPYQFIILSRGPNAGLSNKGWQIIQTDYRSQNELAWHLTGVDTVISTIAGPEQLVLIDAAAAAQVRRFVPSEFCGLPGLRQNGDPNENRRRDALDRLIDYAQRRIMSYTIFSFGIFYEQFGPGGLAASHINTSGSLGGEGSCLVNMIEESARLPYRAYAYQLQTQDENLPYISMISARDAARYVIAALQVSDWPREVTFCAERLSAREVLHICEEAKGSSFRLYDMFDATLVPTFHNRTGEAQYWQLSNIARGVFDLSNVSPSTLDVNLDCEKFGGWLQNAWRPPV